MRYNYVSLFYLFIYLFFIRLFFFYFFKCWKHWTHAIDVSLKSFRVKQIKMPFLSVLVGFLNVHVNNHFSVLYPLMRILNEGIVFVSKDLSVPKLQSTVLRIDS